MVGIATGMIGSAIIGGAVAAYGQHSANQSNQSINANNLAWQERMRNTAYQSTMEDMRKAGLNPILAASRGATGHGTPTPLAMHSATGGVADAIQKSVNSASQVNKTPAELANLVQDTELKLQQMWTAEAQEALNMEQKNYLVEQTAKIRAEVAKIGLESDKIAISNRLDNLRTEFYERFPSAIAWKDLGVEAAIFAPLDNLIRNHNSYTPGVASPADSYNLAP